MEISNLEGGRWKNRIWKAEGGNIEFGRRKVEKSNLEGGRQKSWNLEGGKAKFGRWKAEKSNLEAGRAPMGHSSFGTVCSVHMQLTFFALAHNEAESIL